VGLPPISKSLSSQGFLSQKSRSVTVFRYAKVVHRTGDLTLIDNLAPSKPFGMHWLSIRG
jgi:hypothetical protein